MSDPTEIIGEGKVTAGEEEENDDDFVDGNKKPTSTSNVMNRLDDIAAEPQKLFDALLQETRQRMKSHNSEPDSILALERERLINEHTKRKLSHQHNRNVRDNVLTQLIGRLTTGRAVCEDALNAIREQASADQSYASFSKRLSSFLSEKNKTRNENGTIKQAMVSLYNLAFQTHDHYNDNSEAISKEITQDLVNLIQEMENKIRDVRECASRISRDLNIKAELATDLYNEYQKACIETTRGNAKDDPYVLGIQYRNAVEAFAESEKTFDLEITRLAEEIEFMDRRRIDGIKAVLLGSLQHRIICTKALLRDLEDTSKTIGSVSNDDTLLFNASVHQQLSVNAESAIETIPTMDPHDDDDLNELFAKYKQLPPVVQTLNQVLKPLDTPTTINFEADVIKEGYLKRKGTLLKNWRKSYVVITKNKFLHCFEEKGSIEPEVSVPLKKSDVETLKLEDGNPGFEVLASGVIRRGYTFSTETEQEMVEWICSIKDLAN